MIIRPTSLSDEEKQDTLRRFWQKDPSLWSSDPDVQKSIKNRLGWLDIVPKMRAKVQELKNFTDEIVEGGITRVILMGMGGSSLCPLVLGKIFGPQEGFPDLVVLDTTDPEEIEKITPMNNWRNTLFIFASKSGTTIEPNAMFKYFWPLVQKGVDDPGHHFIAITDPGSPLETLAKEKGFLKVFLNPPDIGGRYSALSYFGLVPAALLGLDLDKMLDRAEEMIKNCSPDVPWSENPGCILGEYLGEFGAQSRDKLSILADEPVKDFGLWLEQLIAESSGKDTRGIVPIIGESTGIPGFYGVERIFVYLRLKETPKEESLDAFVRELIEAELPVHVIKLDDPYSLAGQFFLWEMATALACHFMGVNAFDEPDVRLAKEKTSEVLSVYKKEGKMPIEFWIDPQSQINFRPNKLLSPSMKGLARTIRDLFAILPSWGYVGFLPYLPYEKHVEETIGQMRHLIRQERGCATTLGFGPRYLHSTGQIHKGGPISAAFFIFTRRKKRDFPVIPDFDVSFWHIQFAQAVGDFEALSSSGKRVIHVHLPADFELGLTSFSKVLSRAIRL